jgi:hypothetical protein
MREGISEKEGKGAGFVDAVGDGSKKGGCGVRVRAGRIMDEEWGAERKCKECSVDGWIDVPRC